MSLPDIPSPCVGVCRLSEETRLCEGCMRTAREIARWPFADNAERLEIVQRLRERRRAVGRHEPGRQPAAPAGAAEGVAMTRLPTIAGRAPACCSADGGMGTGLFRWA